MPDKPVFVGELCRVCSPGGRVIIVTWCHRDLKEGEKGLTPKEEVKDDDNNNKEEEEEEEEQLNRVKH
jgi:hypothetical protein